LEVGKAVRGEITAPGKHSGAGSERAADVIGCERTDETLPVSSVEARVAIAKTAQAPVTRDAGFGAAVFTSGVLRFTRVRVEAAVSVCRATRVKRICRAWGADCRVDARFGHLVAGRSAAGRNVVVDRCARIALRTEWRGGRAYRTAIREDVAEVGQARR